MLGEYSFKFDDIETKDIIISLLVSVFASYIYDKIKNHSLSSRKTKSGSVKLDINIKFSKKK